MVRLGEKHHEREWFHLHIAELSERKDEGGIKGQVRSEKSLWHSLISVTSTSYYIGLGLYGAPLIAMINIIRIGGNTQDWITYTLDVTDDPGYYSVFPPAPDVIERTTELFPEAYFVMAGPKY